MGAVIRDEQPLTAAQGSNEIAQNITGVAQAARSTTEGASNTKSSADELSKIWHQQVVVENKGGAGTNLGNELVARSDPDGYTVLYATASLAVARSCKTLNP